MEYSCGVNEYSPFVLFNIIQNYLKIPINMIAII